MKKWMMIALAGMTAGVLMTGCGKSETGAVETAVSAAADSSAESAASDESEARASDENAAESTAAESASVTFTDDLGRELTVENPERVAALLGSFADIWYLAGGEVVASADDAWDDFDLPMAEDAINLFLRALTPSRTWSGRTHWSPRELRWHILMYPILRTICVF